MKKGIRIARSALVPVGVVGPALDARLPELLAARDAAHGAQARAARQLPRLFDQHADLRGYESMR